MIYFTFETSENIFVELKVGKQEMKEKLKKKVLFVCTLNQMRSKTAEELYRHDERFIIKSAGVANEAAVHVDLELLIWADYVIVMEEMHLRWINRNYPIIYADKKVISLDIPDEFFYMQPVLVKLVKQKFEEVYREEIAPESAAGR